jgi:hypothetical protein
MNKRAKALEASEDSMYNRGDYEWCYGTFEVLFAGFS